jgi:hypothetical protein
MPPMTEYRRRIQHEWRCDTCGKYVHEGAVRCANCAFDVPAKIERSRRLLESVDATLRRIDREIAEGR